MVDVLLMEFDEAKEAFESQVDEQQRRDLEAAIVTLDESALPDDASGSEITEAVMAAAGAVQAVGGSDRVAGAKLVALFKKRVLGVFHRGVKLGLRMGCE